MGTPDRGLLSFVARLPAPPASEGDGDLLARYAGAADEAAFAGIVQRHGQMVLAVCRRRLGHGADAEDAFQATFLALAWKAHALDRSGSLAGWLHRVAHLAALKAARQRARHPAGAPLPADVCDPDPPSTACEGHELRALIDAELAALPDKFRSVVVLCLVEGRTSAEAAAVLGVPVGTVDSRLSTARQKLRFRLARRGVAVGVTLSLEQSLGTPLGATDPAAVHELFATTIRAVLAEAARPGAGAVSPAVTHLARGVGTMMMSKLRFAVAVCAAFGVASASAAAYLAGAAPARQEAVAERTPLENPSVAKALRGPDPDLTPVRGESTAAAPRPKGKEAASTQKLISSLQNSVDLDEGNLNDIPLFELLQKISKRFDISFAIAEEAFRNEQVNDMKEKRPNLAVTQLRGLTVEQFLDVVLESMNATYLIRSGRVEIVPIRYAARVTGSELVLDGEERVFLAAPLVTAQIADVPLVDAVAYVAKRYDLSVVVSPHASDTPQATGSVTATLLNVPADRALELLAVQRDLEVIRDGPTFLLTTRANAAEIYKAQLERERHRHELEKLRPAAPKAPKAPAPR